MRSIACLASMLGWDAVRPAVAAMADASALCTDFDGDDVDSYDDYLEALQQASEALESLQGMDVIWCINGYA